MQQKKSGSKTLLMSVLMSAPGPLILSIGLLSGRSSTQLADFFRRSAELLAIICSFVIYQITQKAEMSDLCRQTLEKRSNLFVGAVMCLSGVIMIGLALFTGNEEKGNVIPGLVIAMLGMVANTLFWYKYTKLNRQTPNGILAVQGRLYRAKAMVDTCVTIALAAVALFPASNASIWLDLIGSVVVAVYLILCGIKTIRECITKQ